MPDGGGESPRGELESPDRGKIITFPVERRLDAIEKELLAPLLGKPGMSKRA